MLPKTAKDTKDNQSRLDFFLMCCLWSEWWQNEKRTYLRLKMQHILSPYCCCGGSGGGAAGGAAGQSGGRIKNEHTWGSRCIMSQAPTAAAICWCDGSHGDGSCGDGGCGDYMSSEKVMTGCDVTY